MVVVKDKINVGELRMKSMVNVDGENYCINKLLQDNINGRVEDQITAIVDDEIKVCLDDNINGWVEDEIKDSTYALSIKLRITNECR